MSVTATAQLLAQGKNYVGSGDWLDENNSHDGTLNGSPTFTVDHFVLNGSTQYIQIADDANLDFDGSTDFTLMVVISMPDSTPAADAVVVSKTSVFATELGYGLYIATDGTAHGVVTDGTDVVEDATPALSDGVKVTVAMRVDRTAQEIEMFKDGTSSGSPTDTTAVGSLTNARPIRIGRLGAAGTSWWAGSIYAIALWRSALSDADIVTAGSELTAAGADAKFLVLGIPG